MRRLHIPAPCDAPWDEMTEAPGGRDCARCKTRVIDLTRLSDDDAFVIASSYKGSLCARLLAVSIALSAGCSLPTQSSQSSNVAPSTSGDTDGDGILDVDDKCPSEPEDKDGFEDADGCPDKGKVVIDPQGALPERERAEKLARVLAQHPELAELFE
ncbi:MAG: hypothetical protein ACXWP4_22345 [Polyangiales bacterium]